MDLNSAVEIARWPPFLIFIHVHLLYLFKHRLSAWTIPSEEQSRRFGSYLTLVAHKCQRAIPLGLIFSVVADNLDSKGGTGKAFLIWKIPFFCISSNPHFQRQIIPNHLKWEVSNWSQKLACAHRCGRIRVVSYSRKISLWTIEKQAQFEENKLDNFNVVRPNPLKILNHWRCYC